MPQKINLDNLRPQDGMLALAEQLATNHGHGIRCESCQMSPKFGQNGHTRQKQGGKNKGTYYRRWFCQAPQSKCNISNEQYIQLARNQLEPITFVNDAKLVVGRLHASGESYNSLKCYLNSRELNEALAHPAQSHNDSTVERRQGSKRPAASEPSSHVFNSTHSAKRCRHDTGRDPMVRDRLPLASDSSRNPIVIYDDEKCEESHETTSDCAIKLLSLPPKMREAAQ